VGYTFRYLRATLKDANRRKFDVVMAWAIDRLGRSLVDLLGAIQHLEATGVDLYLDQENLNSRWKPARWNTRTPCSSAWQIAGKPYIHSAWHQQECLSVDATVWRRRVAETRLAVLFLR
jgi:hypothetical protein